MRLRCALLALLTLLGSGLALAQPPQATQTPQVPLIPLVPSIPSSTALFAATLTGLDGQPQALVQWQGKPLIVNFWARWCGPCRIEIPELIKLRRHYQARGLEVLGIGIEDQTESVRDFAKAYEMDYPILIGKDKGLALMRTLGNTKMGLPFTVAIDRAGQLVVIKMGTIKGDELVAAADAALKKSQ